jgi:2-C-methyl-D-erythritol 4-phosphate cytidylyltransferase
MRCGLIRTAPHSRSPPMPTDLSRPSCTAILVAAGSSRRMGFDKLAAPLGGKPVLRWALEAFLAADSIDAVVIVGLQERRALLAGMEFGKPVTLVEGGSTRQKSVARGLAALGTGVHLVAVHDGARPLVSPADIDRCVASASMHRAATLARRSTETMKRSDAADFSAESVSRENLWCMETPQVFEAALLQEAYQAVATRELEVTDEVSAVQSIGVRVKFIESLHPNIKITTVADLALARALLK